MSTVNPFANTQQADSKVTETNLSAKMIPATGCYKALCTLAYLTPDKSVTTNQNLFINIKLSCGYEWNLAFYGILQNGKATDAEGKNFYSFDKATRLVFSLTGKTLFEVGAGAEDKTLNVKSYDRAKGKFVEAPTSVVVFSDLIEAECLIGLTRKVANRRKNVAPEGAKQKWVDTAERKETAEMAQVANLSGYTRTEVYANAVLEADGEEPLEPAALRMWMDKFTGKDHNTFKEVRTANKATGAAQPGAAKATPAPKKWN